MRLPVTGLITPEDIKEAECLKLLSISFKDLFLFNA
jgi:hypothetical protein